MKEWTKIRTRVWNEGVSKRQILRETGMHWKTLNKILSHGKPPGYRVKKERPKRKLGGFLHRIEQILREDREQNVPQKQRHTGKRIFERLREEGYEGGYTVVKDAVREFKERLQEVFVPLEHPPGEAQVDFGEAVAKVGGQLRKVVFFVMALPYSDAFFVMACERECTETFWEGHVRAFEFFEGVPRRITYDNSRIAIKKIVGVHERKLTQGFLELQSHYTFLEHFCSVRRPNEKGVVEGIVKYARRNFMVPVPHVESLEELNVKLAECCRSDRERRLRGQKGTKEELLKEDQTAFLPLPPSRFDACRKRSTRANSLSLVRFDRNDYSVPSRYAHHPIVMKGYVDRVILCFEKKAIAEHERCWRKEEVLYDPVHYLAVLEEKPGAFDHARPLANWNLPDGFEILRRRLEGQLGRGQGTREYIRVLQLLEKHRLEALTRAVHKALRVITPSRDVVAQYLYGEETGQSPRFRLEGREHLRGVRVDSPNLQAYQAMLSGGVR
jgi:transposase